MSAPARRMFGLLPPLAGRVAAATLAGAGAAASGIGLMAASAWLISRAAQHPPVLYLTVAIVAVRAFGLSRGVLRYLERLLGHDAALRLLGPLRERCYARLERLAPAGLTGTRTGDLVARFVSDLDTALDVLTRVVLPYLVAGVVGLATAALLGALLPAAAVVLLLGLATIGVGVPWLQSALDRRASGRTADLRGELAAQSVELMHGLPDLIAFGAAGQRLAQASRTDQQLARAEARTSGSIGLGGAFVSLVAGGCVWATLTLATPAVRDGRLDGVLLAVLVLTPLAVFELAGTLPAAAAHWSTARPALDRALALLDRPDPVPDPVTPATLPAPPYHVSLVGVAARWQVDGPEVLAGLDLDLPAGRRVALIGPSGCGKSTVAALLVRFLDPAAGRITLNGTDLRDLRSDQVRQVVGLVSEDAYLFDTTLEENLRLGRPAATGAELRQVLRKVRLLDWVDALPEGLSTAIGEHGSRLSGGQRRRLLLARALLADFPVLILDEPAEHLDEPTAAAITADLMAEARGRTLVLITHRRHGLAGMDEVVDLSRYSRTRSAWRGTTAHQDNSSQIRRASAFEAASSPCTT
ncbi:MAG TPA: thiol reductant ABC exporter subunit CydC [Micromonosporaceae bacterium]